MRCLSFIIILLGWSVFLLGQNPHGDQLKLDCAACHTTEGWEIAMDSWNFEENPTIEISQTTGLPIGDDANKFNHFNTAFSLEGQHKGVDCRACHENLVFDQANTDCISCHVDLHQQTVGSDCARCHNVENWLVDNITELHQENGFPLLGVHAQINCTECHESETGLQFHRIGNECINCHQDDFNATTDPNHIASGFSIECIDCHRIEGFDWSSEFINHDFFPLVKGHDISDCNACHTNGDFKNTPTDCFACHQTDYQTAQNPNHQSADFSTDCTECHTLDIDWMPAEYLGHDNLFPIYSGSHEGEWDNCIDCHLNPSDFSDFTCTTCHERNETDDDHDNVNGYVYESRACLACHPTGSEEDNFDHNRTRFPLNGAHVGLDCTECHANGFTGTPTDCAACHQADFNSAKDPDHVAGGFSMECQVCHSEDAWKPAIFDHDDTNFPLRGGHIGVDCIECHADGYAGTPTDCASCHQDDFNSAKDPDHVAGGFSMECQVCHSESAWEPAIFDHDETNFPLRGGHIGVDCIACHADGYAGTPTNCAACHQDDFSRAKDPDHVAGGFSMECQVCHSETVWEPAIFDHDETNFPLKGGHIGVDCIACHADGYAGTPTDCVACHQADYDATIAPNHIEAGFSIDCKACHTEGAWEPAIFDHDQTDFPLRGAHAMADCIACHADGYAGTPTDCVACHQADYDATTNPDHKASGFNTDCMVCHSETTWIPATFDHNDTNFPLTGAHITTDCIECHADGYAGTPTDCAACHQTDFNQTTNPNHTQLGLSNDCVACHTTEPNWMPATFDIHDQYFALRGAHAAIKNDCAACHNGDYNNTPNTCFGCHQNDYNNANNPNHRTAGFPTDCESCHSEVAWEPANFDHDAMYFPIYSGNHRGEWQQCIECHTMPGDFKAFSCIDCHEHNDPNDLRDEHDDVNNYRYESNACYECHPRGEE